MTIAASGVRRASAIDERGRRSFFCEKVDGRAHALLAQFLAAVCAGDNSLD